MQPHAALHFAHQPQCSQLIISISKLTKIFHEAAYKYSAEEAAWDAQLPGVDRRSNTYQRRNTNTATPGVQTENTAIPGVGTTNSEPTYRLRNREVRTITTEAMLSAIEVSTTQTSAKRLASRRFPLQLLCEMAGAVLDKETGELLEYRHPSPNQTTGVQCNLDQNRSQRDRTTGARHTWCS